jgi:acyl-CoA-binding protein
MQTLEFETYSKNRIIEIPEQYKDFDNSKLKVIILKEETSDDIDNKKSAFFDFVKKHKYDIPTDYNFDREEIYER